MTDLARKLGLLTGVIILLFSAGLANSGDVTVRISDSAHNVRDKVLLGMTNYLEFWIQNDVALDGMVLTFRVDFQVPIVWVKPYGNRPAPQPGIVPCIKEYGDAIGAFDLGNLQFTDKRDNVTPDTFMLNGAASTIPLPRHGNHTMLYDIAFNVFPGTDSVSNAFCVDNLFIGPGDSWWMFAHDGSGSWIPSYQSDPNPDAPPVCFNAVHLPCKGCESPQFTVFPGTQVSQNHCLPYTFDFEAIDPNNPPAYPLTYSTSVGSINSSTGELTVPAPGAVGTTDVLVSVVSASSWFAAYPFKITWTNNRPTLTNCPVSVGEVSAGGSYQYPFTAPDADPCDTVSFAVSPSGTPPVGSFGVDGSGNFSFAADAADDGGTFGFEMITSDNDGGVDSCQFVVSVRQPLCGDCDGSDVVNVSDAVYLIGYIFAGTLPPNPPLVGDVNCDAMVNVSDAVRLIGYIFAGGAAPCTGTGCK